MVGCNTPAATPASPSLAICSPPCGGAVAVRLQLQVQPAAHVLWYLRGLVLWHDAVVHWHPTHMYLMLLP